MATKSKKAIKISQKHLLGIQDLSVSDVTTILDEASKFIELNKSKKMSNLYLFFSFKSYAASNHVDHEDVNIIGLYGKTMYIIDNKNLIVEKGDLLSIKKGTMHRSIALGPRIILSHGVYS